MMSDNAPPAADFPSNGDEVTSPLSRRRSLPSPWASVVRGDSEQNSGHVAPGSSSSPPPEQTSGLDNSLIESSGPEAQPESYDGSDDGNAGRARRPAWNRPLNGVVEPASVMGGAVSWPALSETTRPVSRSVLLDNARPVSDGSVSSSQAPILLQPPQRPVNDNAQANSAVNNAMPTRPRSRNRNGGSSTGMGPSQNTFNQLPLQMPPPFPYGMVPTVLDTPVRGTRPVGGLGGSPSHTGNDHSQRNNSRRGGGYGPRPRGDGQYHNNHGGRRDQGRRDVHHPPPYGPPHMGYMPSHLPPGVTPFLASPPMRVFPGQMGFDMAPFIYYPTMPPESFRPMPMVPPSGPPPFAPANENTLAGMILKQIEFYFSDTNLVRDNYLRLRMDDQGWVPITLIASFRRVQQLTKDIQLILESLRYSTVVEVQGDKVRRRNEWRRWLPPPSWLNAGPGSQTSGAHENELATSLQGISLDDTRTNVNGNRDVMEGHTEMNSGGTGQSAGEVRAISV